MALRFSFAKRAVLAGIALAAGVAVQPAFAADDGYENVFSSVLTAVGIMPGETAPEIDYRERPPLVLPPKTSLVKPQVPGARRTAAWPKDPDIVRRRKEAEEARTPVYEFDKSADRPIPKDEMLKFRAQQEEQVVAPSGCNLHSDSLAQCRSNPDEMRAEEARFRALHPEVKNEITAGVEPDREYLTEPPRGYRKATRTVAVTSEAPVKQHDLAHPLSSYISSDTKSIDPLKN